MSHGGDGKSNVEKALATVKVSEHGLTKLPEPQRSWQMQNRRTRKRDSLIYRDWLAAEDKEAAIASLRERWGFKHRGHILRIIEKGKSGVIPAMAADVEVLRRVKREEVLRDGESRMAEIDLQLRKLRLRRRLGDTFVDSEIVETVGGKNGAETKTKRVTINAEIRRLEAEKSKSHAAEAAALADYTPKQTDGRSGFERGVDAATEFVEAFTRLGQIAKGTQPIDVEAEIIQESQGGA